MRRSMTLLRAMTGLLGIGNTPNLPKEFFENEPKGRPKIHKDRPKPRERSKDFLSTRHKKLPKFLDELKRQRTQINLENKHCKSHRSKEQQEKRDLRLQHITAKRFDISPGQHFSFEALYKMCSLGVVKAVKQVVWLRSQVPHTLSPENQYQAMKSLWEVTIDSTKENQTKKDSTKESTI